MTVQSLTYILCLPVALLLSWLGPAGRPRQAALLVLSYLFYSTWGVPFVALLIASSLANYGLGEWLRRHPSAARLWIAIIINIVLLATFKYLPSEAHVSGWVARLGVPVGISFWTFEALSYLLDIYRGEELNPSLVEFCLFLAFWPTVLSGPVCRLPEMLPQFRTLCWSWDDVSEGARRIVIGLCMKVAFAQILASGLVPGQGVNAGFDQLAAGWGGLDVWILAFGYGFQLFFDFAGYSNIAIGSARLFGLRLPENFDDPYISRTPSEFWTRWHMSLSFWIRDYVFMPLAMLGRSLPWRLIAIFFSMVLFGLWHGATALFLLWGSYHGLLLVGHRAAQLLSRRIDLSHWSRFIALTGWGVTFALVNLGWIFFRANSLAQAASMYRAVLQPSTYRHIAVSPNLYLVTALMISAYFGTYAARELIRMADLKWAGRVRWILSPVVYSAAIILTIVWSTQTSVFVYLRF